MSKRFVKIRYPEAYSVKTHGWIKNDPFIIRNRVNGMIFKGNDVNEKQAWANLKVIIQEQEKAEKGLTELEIRTRRAEIARIELQRIKNKKKIRKYLTCIKKFSIFA